VRHDQESIEHYHEETFKEVHKPGTDASFLEAASFGSSQGRHSIDNEDSHMKHPR
jgi:hypothetical protein